jgi:homoserine O-acetyltransferase
MKRHPLRPWEDENFGYEVFSHEEPVSLDWGRTLPRFDIAYETWGELNDAKDNAVLLHTGLSASSHARCHTGNQNPGWWESFIGYGRPLDTNRHFIICTNVLGGCYGSTGPSSQNPITGDYYATDFPVITIDDMIRAQAMVLDHLGIDSLFATVGSSLGGMQSLAFASLYPERARRVISISASARSYPQTIAMRYVQRAAIMADPDWNGGRYYDKKLPHRGMKVAREIGTITYRSGPEWDNRFGRTRNAGLPGLGVDFEVESYISYQGAQFCTRYDANSQLYISKAMDLFDVADRLDQVQGSALIIGVTSDVLFPVWQQREVAELIDQGPAAVNYVEVNAPTGHDTFLINMDDMGPPIAEALKGE